MPPPLQTFIAGASGFIGRVLVKALRSAGYAVRGSSRRADPTRLGLGETWVQADVLVPATLPAALEGVEVAYYLVHSMESGRDDFARDERRGAQAFALAASRAGVQRIVYLGGPVPAGPVSEHLASRLEVGHVLRSEAPRCLELRASVIVGAGSASWQLARDLALRSAVLALPSWATGRMAPIALDDVLRALVAAATVPAAQSEAFDLPGPEVFEAAEFLSSIAKATGRRLPVVHARYPAPKRVVAAALSRLSGINAALAYELIGSLGADLSPRDDRWFARTAHGPRVPFDEAVRRALAAEQQRPGLAAALFSLQESLVDGLGRRLLPHAP